MPTVIATQISAEEFAGMPNPVDGSRQELVRGEVEEMPPVKGRRGIVQLEIGSILRAYVKPRKLGWLAVESGTILERNPDTVRGPDVAFYSMARQPEMPEGYFEIRPDLAVEVLSPDDRRKNVREKISEYIASGVKLVWLVDPEAQTVMVYCGTTRGIEYGDADSLDGGEVLPGFTCTVAELFT